MLKLTIIFLFIAAKEKLTAQLIFPKKIEPVNFNIDSLNYKFGKHKQFIPEFKLQTLIALSGYPELKDDLITFKYHQITTTGKTTLTASSFLKRTHHYIIFINTNTRGKSVLLKDAPFNAQVGLIAHELGHIADFKNKRLGNFMQLALAITFSKNKHAMMEKNTDYIAIEHGFGWQLYDWISFVLNDSAASKKYKSFKRKFYLQPFEIAGIIKKNEVN